MLFLSQIYFKINELQIYFVDIKIKKKKKTKEVTSGSFTYFLQ